MPEAAIAFIGGSGLYDMEELVDRDEVSVQTPFGNPSDSIILGTLSEARVAFLPRHGRGHRISPTDLPARANIYALKVLGVQRIVSISVVGSLKEEVRPRDIVIPDQIIDRTKARVATFFDEGIVGHVGFADPFCPILNSALADAASSPGVIDQASTVHSDGTYVAIEGPQFSTRAESRLYRSWGASVIGMTALPEAKLAREAEICYSTLAFATDYDVWHDSEKDVSVEMVIASLLSNVAAAKRVIGNLVPMIPAERACSCESALRAAIITDRSAIPDQAIERLGPIVARYLS